MPVATPESIIDNMIQRLNLCLLITAVKMEVKINCVVMIQKKKIQCVLPIA